MMYDIFDLLREKNDERKRCIEICDKTIKAIETNAVDNAQYYNMVLIVHEIKKRIENP